MTLTLPKRNPDGCYDRVYINDVCDELLARIPSKLKKNAYYRSHVIYGHAVSEEEALNVYQEYKEHATLVITSRLHCAIPCLAMGIPVIFAPKILAKRYVWVDRFIPIYSESEWDRIDWSTPPKYPI